MRLEHAFTPTGQYDFFYDPLNRLVGYRPNLNGGALDDRYYDGADMVLQFRRQNAGNQWVRFVYGPGADQPLAMEVYPVAAAPTPGSGQVFYYHADGEGSIRLLTDANAQVANRYDYDSFGKPLTVVEAVAQPYTWKAREWFSGTGLYYNRARFYDPQLGRFTTEDPWGYGGGDTNLYVLAWNNPRNWNDPSGLFVLSPPPTTSPPNTKPKTSGGGSAAGEYAAIASTILSSTPILITIGCLVSIQISEAAAAENPAIIGFRLSKTNPCIVEPVLGPTDPKNDPKIPPKQPNPTPEPKDSEPCDEQWRKARAICQAAKFNNWESDYNVGPDPVPSWWTIEDCAKGLVSEVCGGNPVDRNKWPKRPKRKEFAQVSSAMPCKAC